MNYIEQSAIAALEHSLILQLASRLNPINVAVESFPADPRLLGEPLQTTTVLVGFRSSNDEVLAEDEQINRSKVYRSEINFIVQIDFLDLVAHHGAYVVLEQIRIALQGFIPDMSPFTLYQVEPDPCLIEGFDFQGLADGNIYQYTARVQCPITYAGVKTAQTKPFDPALIRVGLWKAVPGDLGDNAFDQLIEVPQ